MRTLSIIAESIIMLSVIYADCPYDECQIKAPYAECHIKASYAKCRFAECRYAESRGAIL
jgi:hypothetical protein